VSGKRLTLRIKGRVQGVFYRQSAKEEAERLGLTGWVKNLPDGDVLALAEGDPERLQRFVAWCQRGPPMAQVADVQVEEGAATGALSRFSVEP
jgi:acylphosphatase